MTVTSIDHEAKSLAEPCIRLARRHRHQCSHLRERRPCRRRDIPKGAEAIPTVEQPVGSRKQLGEHIRLKRPTVEQRRNVARQRLGIGERFFGHQDREVG